MIAIIYKARIDTLFKLSTFLTGSDYLENIEQVTSMYYAEERLQSEI